MAIQKERHSPRRSLGTLFPWGIKPPAKPGGRGIESIAPQIPHRQGFGGRALRWIASQGCGVAMTEFIAYP